VQIYSNAHINTYYLCSSLLKFFFPRLIEGFFFKNIRLAQVSSLPLLSKVAEWPTDIWMELLL